MLMRLTIRRPGRTTYDLNGTTFEDLVAAMDRHGCWGRYTFPYSHRATGPARDVAEIHLTISPNIEMPRWRHYNRAPDPQKREWDRMIGALGRHEQGHHDLLVRKAEDFRDSIPNISMAMDRRAVDRMMQDFGREAQNIMVSFDSRTDHGRRNGVELQLP